MLGKMVGDFIAAHSTHVALREGVLYDRGSPTGVHYELEQISMSEILQELKKGFSGTRSIQLFTQDSVFGKRSMSAGLFASSSPF